MTQQNLKLIVEFLEAYADSGTQETVEPWEWPETWGHQERKDFVFEMLNRGNPSVGWGRGAEGEKYQLLVDNPDTFHISNGEMAAYLAAQLLGEL